MAGDDNNLPGKLNDSALSDLGLGEQPFLDQPHSEGRKREHLNDTLAQSLRSQIEQGLKHGGQLHLLLGARGAGKSVLLSQLVRHNSDYIKPFIARGDDNFEAKAFLTAILSQLGEDDPGETSAQAQALHEQFSRLNAEQTSVALVVDNAHHAPIEEIAELIGLMPQLMHDDQPVARLLLTGEGSLKTELDALTEEFEMPEYAMSNLPALDGERTRNYLGFRLNQAGYTGEFPFTDNAVHRIQQNAAGIPAEINTHAAQYLNKVYTGTGAGVAANVQGGIIGTLGWPIIGLGAAAIGLIIWGLSMFGSGAPDPDTSIDADGKLNSTGQSANNDVSGTGNSVTTGSETTNSDTTVPAADGNDLLMPQHRDNTEAQTWAGTDTDASDAQALAASETQVGDSADGASASDTPATHGDQQQTDSSGSIANDQSTTVQTDSDTGSEASQNTDAQTSDVAGSDNGSASTSDAGDAGSSNAAASQNNSDASNQASSTTSDSGGTNSSGSDGTPTAKSTGSSQKPVSVAIPENSSDTSQSSIAVPLPGTDTGGEPIPMDATDGNSSVSVNVPNNTVSVPVRAVENERWILFQPDSKFTIQLATSRERSYMMKYAQSLPLTGPMAIYPFTIKSNGNQVYGLLTGLYDSFEDALAAIEEMPQEVREFDPWIRPIKQLQNEIR